MGGGGGGVGGGGWGVGGGDLVKGRNVYDTSNEPQYTSESNLFSKDHKQPTRVENMVVNKQKSHDVLIFVFTN